MANQIKQLSKHVFIFGFGDYLKGIVAFLLIPVYTRYLTPADYGQLELLNMTLSILSVLAVQGIGAAFVRSYYLVEKEMQTSDRDLISTSYFYMALSALFVSALLYIFSGQYSMFLFGKNSAPEIFVRIVAFTLCFQTIMQIPYQLLIAKMKSVKYIALSFTQFLLQVFLNIFFVTVLELGLKGVLLGNAISSFIVVIITFLLIRGHLDFKISKKILTDLLSFGLPLVMTSILTWVLSMSDRFLLQKLSSTQELGLYSLGSRFASILPLLVVTPFQNVWGTISIRIAAEDKAKETFKIITTYFFLVLCFIGIILIVWTPPGIKFIAGKEFWDAYRVVLPLVAAQITYGMLLISGLGIYLLKRTIFTPLAIGMGAIVNIAMNVMIIPRYGMVGAAFDSFIAYIVMNFLFYRIGQKLYYIPFEKIRLLKISSVFLVVSAFSFVQCSHIGIDILFRSLLTLLFFASLIMIGFFEKQEIQYFRRTLYELRESKGFSSKIRYVSKLVRS